VKAFHNPTPTERDLVGLADGSLPASRRVRVERAVAASPELQAIVAAQRCALSAIDRAAHERAPHALRARLELMRAPEHTRRQTRRRTRLPRLLPAGGLATAAAAAAVAIVLTLGGGAGAPTVAQAAVLATRPALAGAPAQNGKTASLKGVSGAGLDFPYWEDLFGFRATGVRHDTIDGRAATTVFYRKGDMRVAYTIVSGRPLAWGTSASRASTYGIPVWTLHAHGLRVATWRREGHTCVLAGAGNVPDATLVSLASWRAGGGLHY
jgi:hypothetical protein